MFRNIFHKATPREEVEKARSLALRQGFCENPNLSLEENTPSECQLISDKLSRILAENPKNTALRNLSVFATQVGKTYDPKVKPMARDEALALANEFEAMTVAASL